MFTVWRQRGTPRATRGASLVEIVGTLAVGSMLLALAAPAYRDFIAAKALADHAHALAQALNLARSEAIKRGARVDVCTAAAGSSCSEDGGWTRGWIVFVDEEETGDIDDDASILRRQDVAPERIRIVANQPVARYVSFTPLGHARMLGGALQMGTFSLCMTGQREMRVILANSGRARVERGEQRCP